MSKDSTLDNLNINSYFMSIDKLPDFNYKLKEVTLPSFTLQAIDVPNPLQKMKVPGDTIDYSVLSVSFIVDENVWNYLGIYEWMRGLGFPNSYEEFIALKSRDYETVLPTKRNPSYSTPLTSDITLHLLTNHRNSNKIIRYNNAFPISLSGFTLTNSNTDSEVVQATAEFAYTGMHFEWDFK